MVRVLYNVVIESGGNKMQFVFGAISGVLIYLNWAVISPWIESVLKFTLTFFN